MHVVDGEGVGDRYFLLGAFDGSRHLELLASDGRPLGTREIFDFVLDLGSEVWLFSGDYDFQHWLRDLDSLALSRLSRRGHTHWRGYRIEHVPGKSLAISAGRRRVQCWDVYPFVHTSFVRWLDQWGIPYARARVAAGKAERSDLSRLSLDEVRAYNRAELEGMYAGVCELKERVFAAGLSPRSWHSPGSLAAEVLRAEGVEPPSPEHRSFEPALQAYFGGRFEVAAIGRIDRPVYEYDLRSAYPAVLRDLPSGQGHFVRVTSGGIDRWSLVRVRWSMPEGVRWGPWPVRVREDAPLVWPLAGESWIWGRELIEGTRYLDEIPGARYEICEIWRYVPDDDRFPFAFVQHLYDRRRRAPDGESYVLKLILNSLYGKVAQRQGFRGLPGRWYSPVWAGLVTSETRARLLEVIRRWPEQVFMVATDAVFSLEPLSVVCGRDLGLWSLQCWDRAFVVRPGVYFLWKDGELRVRKLRGLRGTIDYRIVEQSWGAEGIKATLPIRQTRFVGYREALHRRDLRVWRAWENFDWTLSFNPAPRRRLERIVDGRADLTPVESTQDIATYWALAELAGLTAELIEQYRYEHEIPSEI